MQEFCSSYRVTVVSFVFIVMTITKEKTGEPYRLFVNFISGWVQLSSNSLSEAGKSC